MGVDCHAFQPDLARRRAQLRDLRPGRPNGNPATIDQNGKLTPIYFKWRQHVISGYAVHHPVVEQNRMRIVKRPCHFEFAIQHAIAIERQASHMDRRLFYCSIVPRLQFALGCGAVALPVAEPDCQHKEKHGCKRRQNGRCKPPRANTHVQQVHAADNPVRLKLCRVATFMRILALLFIVFILASLASALYFLIKDKGQSDRTVKMLTVRIALSLILFVLLMAGYYFGAIPHTGLR
jgi:hypothetical protein